MKKFLEFIANNWENEQEYAGRMETWCFYCGAYQERRQPEVHNEGCLHLEAVVELAKEDDPSASKVNS